MSRLFTEFYFKEQVEYPDHIPTSTVDISNCASEIKKLGSAIDGVQLLYLYLQILFDIDS